MNINDTMLNRIMEVSKQVVLEDGFTYYESDNGVPVRFKLYTNKYDQVDSVAIHVIGRGDSNWMITTVSMLYNYVFAKNRPAPKEDEMRRTEAWYLPGARLPFTYTTKGIKISICCAVDVEHGDLERAMGHFHEDSTEYKVLNVYVSRGYKYAFSDARIYGLRIKETN